MNHVTRIIPLVARTRVIGALAAAAHKDLFSSDWSNGVVGIPHFFVTLRVRS